MKILFLYNVNQYSVGLAGIFKKLLGQMVGVSSQGVDVYAVYMSKSRQVLAKWQNEQLIEQTAWPDIQVATQKKQFWENATQLVNQGGFDCLYARYDFMLDNSSILDFYQQVKPNCGLKVLEFPTFPYEDELQGRVGIDTDRAHREQLNDCVDLVFSTSRQPPLQQVKNIFFANKISDQLIKHASQSIRPLLHTDQSIRLLTIANNCHWHGFDRLLYGLAEYYAHNPSRPVYYDLVGEGPELAQLRSLIKSLNLTQYVNVVGFKQGVELNEFMDSSSVGIASLGLYRIDLFESSVLKVREYLANGLPIVYACEDPDLTQFPHKLVCPNSNAAIEIQRVVDFVEQLNQNTNIRDEIRQYAQANLTWSAFGSLLIETITPAMQQLKD
ncbi:hypothetical protein N7931_03770 [Catenovulum sp. 2E275]|uniref:glycosyltransferase n=1 Tax=Catenovulum sp. 2E275 TaxID=2980497 RepID=UPI0021D398D2|nr:glycosyltransferase [Catenovulum sp. 2E275]MCU4674745.1 hypothetical protein [Catenovulum sp. 2E275]